jgi:hypothetical protein
MLHCVSEMFTKKLFSWRTGERKVSYGPTCSGALCSGTTLALTILSGVMQRPSPFEIFPRLSPNDVHNFYFLSITHIACVLHEDKGITIDGKSRKHLMLSPPCFSLG